MAKTYTIEMLSDELDMALRLIKSGHPTLLEAKHITQHFREVFVEPELFPNDTGAAQNVASRLAVIQELELALDRVHGLGVSPKTRLREVPFLDTALRHSLDEAVAGRPGGISFR
ncbi:hypothetical protein [Chromobacterium violaceum]|uniref:hypothetical protein n=1 Tax=Chromobacterium violaceum TaxID=536 RepID=UPI0005BE6A2D|nr:hypothetical protein [Chromobacterium violaceum]